jgi:SAM-dependent methyltransferase
VVRSTRGLGTSEWEGFAPALANKFDYRNTYLDDEPRLDLKNVSPHLRGQFDFVICSEVLEHVAPPVQPAFDGLYSLLKPGGVLIFSVPYQIDCGTIEHFKDLNEWSLCQVGERQVLVNRKVDGKYEVFDQLRFHGGGSPALEMRIFGKSDLEHRLTLSGFAFQFFDTDYPPFGIYWPQPWSLPLRARKKA